MAMSRRVGRELRMLRELAHYFLPMHTCVFCGQPLAADEWEHFGHGTPPPVKAQITIHHADGHPEGDIRGKRNNSRTNLGPSHRKCHKAHEMKLRYQKRKENGNGSGKKDQVPVENKSKSQAHAVLRKTRKRLAN